MSIFGSVRHRQALIVRFGSTMLSILMACAPAVSQPQHSKPSSSIQAPIPAIPAILAIFDRYEVVAMPEAHGNKDQDDFILALIRDPGFPEKVNDIVVECGNSLYQPVLDLYIAGMDVPFVEVRKVWRDTTQSMCGFSGFFEQFFPLIRAINQKLPAAKRLRVLAGDPPIDWDKVKTSDDAFKFFDRGSSIVAVMEKEVLSKHRKALMLFGIMHLMHGAEHGAVATYEKIYPNRTFVVSDLGGYDTSRPVASISPFASWPSPSLVIIKGTPLGDLSLSDLMPPPVHVSHPDCKVKIEFPPTLQRPMDTLVDAFLYLGPQSFRLNEPTPADIALDTEYMTEMQRRESLVGIPGMSAPRSQQQFSDEIVQGAETPILEAPPRADPKDIEQSCRAREKQRSPQ